VKIHHKNSFRKQNLNGITHRFFAHNTITIFLVEITTNKRFISYNNQLNYSLKYGKTGDDFWNFYAMGSSGKFKRSSVDSQTGQPGMGGGWWTRRTGVPGTGGEKANLV
jgi:hypothetical protein